MAEMILNPKKCGWAAAKTALFLRVMIQIGLLSVKSGDYFSQLAIFSIVGSLLVAALYGFLAGYLFAYFYNKS